MYNEHYRHGAGKRQRSERMNVQMSLQGQKNPSKRRQQVQRYWLIIGLVAVLAAAGILSGFYFIGKNRDADSKEISLTRQQEELWRKAGEEAGTEVETADEHLERIRMEATMQGYPEGVIELLDKNPLLRNGVGIPLGSQSVDRRHHRRAADSQMIRDILGNQSGTRGEGAVLDPLFDFLVCIFAQRGGLLGCSDRHEQKPPNIRTHSQNEFIFNYRSIK